ncbi:MAG TPA: cupin domain-containing protein [Segetibacter sp.]|nr:cupin domain-containing protein [Segetibacter sp.]
MNNVLTPAVNINRKWKLAAYLFYPTGVIRIWKSKRKLWLRLLYTIIGLPLFLAVVLFVGITGFALFLPHLDMAVGNRPDRTIYNSNGNYKSTLLKTGAETNGAYELIKVEVEPHGGNEWHYHKNFEEHFTVLKGTAKVGKNGQEYLVKQGDSATAYKREMHYFANPTDSTIQLLVRATPARGLEKSIRVVYGLANDGQFNGPITKNPWHMALLLGYSGTYLPNIPGFIQEPLVDALAKIAQWKGEDKSIEKYFK